MEVNQRLLDIGTLLKVKKEFFQQRSMELDNIISESREDILILEQAISVLSKLAELSRKDSIERIEKLITFALRTIYEDNSFKFLIEEKEVGASISYDFKIQMGEEQPVSVRDGSGGGISNIVSVFLAIAIAIFQDPSSRRFFILDERFNNVSPSLRSNLAAIIKLFAEKLNMQIVLISHQQELIEAGDKVYRFALVKGRTTVTDITNKDKGLDE